MYRQYFRTLFLFEQCQRYCHNLGENIKSIIRSIMSSSTTPLLVTASEMTSVDLDIQQKPNITSFTKLGFIPVLLCCTSVWFNSSVNPCSVSASCGSCYSFASMGMLEARIRILTNNSETPMLSPQQVVSCSEYSQGKLTLNVKSILFPDSNDHFKHLLPNIANMNWAAVSKLKWRSAVRRNLWITNYSEEFW